LAAILLNLSSYSFCFKIFIYPEVKPAYLSFLGPFPALPSSSSKRSPMLVELASGSSFADNFKLISSSIGQS
jgi:hypothetical protein